jgi:hypothetical protein
LAASAFSQLRPFGITKDDLIQEWWPLPVLLDLLTVFFLVAGCALLWLNLRPRRPRIVITDDPHQSAPTGHIPEDAEIRALLAALKPPASEIQVNPEAEEDNAYVNRFAEGRQIK